MRQPLRQLRLLFLLLQDWLLLEGATSVVVCRLCILGVEFCGYIHYLEDPQDTPVCQGKLGSPLRDLKNHVPLVTFLPFKVSYLVGRCIALQTTVARAVNRMERTALINE